MTIRANERVAREIEGLIAKQLNGTLSPTRRYPYDVETLTDLIEVKSCRPKTKGRKKGLKEQFMQCGRFVILVNSHKRLKAEAEQIGKTATYLFTLYQANSPPKILKQKRLSWKQVDSLIKDAKIYIRRDNTKLAVIYNTNIF